LRKRKNMRKGTSPGFLNRGVLSQNRTPKRG
jgi:hypothetical protein